MRTIARLLATCACLLIAGCGHGAANNAGGTPAATATATTSPEPTPAARDAGPVHDDHNRLCRAIDPAALKRATDAAYDWAAPKLTAPTGQTGWSCVSSNAAQKSTARTLSVTVVLNGCVEWRHSLEEMRKASGFQQLGIGDEGGYVTPRIAGMRVGTECFSILSSVTQGTKQDETMAGKATRTVATHLAEILKGTPSASPTK